MREVGRVPYACQKINALIDAFNCGAGEDSWESFGQQGDQISQSKRKSTLNIQWKDWCWSWSSNTLVTWCEDPTHWKRPYAGEDWGQEEKGAIEMAGWHHRLNGHEFEQIPGESEGQGSLTCCSPWGCNDSDMTNNNKTMRYTLNAQLKYRFLE